MKCGTTVNGIRFSNKNKTGNERALMQKWWTEVTNLYGTYVEYHVYNYQLSAHDAIYGEHTTANFSTPFGMVVLAQLNNDSILLSKFGIQTDADLTIVVPYTSFTSALSSQYGLTIEPKAQDLIVLSELGWDRPGASRPYPTGNTGYCSTTSADTFNGLNSAIDTSDWRRGPNVYEITERRDENLPAGFNALQGHYVWIIKCKRHDYSYQPNAPREIGSNQVSDETLYGKLSGGTVTAEPAKVYTQNADESAQELWDYTEHGNLDSEYGKYQ